MTKKVETPKELARMFAELNSDAQAIFFETLASIVSQWEADFRSQVQAIFESTEITTKGRSVMRAIGGGKKSFLSRFFR